MQTLLQKQSKLVAKSRSAGPRGAGFTIVELMVALTVGGLAIGSMYAIGSATTRQFYSQQQVASAQTSLRMAMAQVRRDIARAGYLASPNVTVAAANPPKPPQTCALVGAPLDSATGRLAAFSRFANDVPMVATGAGANDALDPTGNNRANGFTADDIVLYANYETADEYPGIYLPNPAAPSTVALSQSWHGFTRDFTNWSQVVGFTPPTFDIAAFQQAFAVGRLIRIQTTRRQRHFAIITNVTAPVGVTADPIITFDPPVPAPCVGDVAQGWIAPVSALRYYVRNATGDEAPRSLNSTGPIGQLVREEVQPNNVPALFNGASSRVVLDYVVAFNLSFAMTGDTAAGQPDLYDPGVYINNPATVNAKPQLIRAVQIDLAVRTPEQDASMPWTQTGCSNLACFQVFPTTGAQARVGSSRVRRLRTEVFVPNVAYEGY